MLSKSECQREEINLLGASCVNPLSVRGCWRGLRVSVGRWSIYPEGLAVDGIVKKCCRAQLFVHEFSTRDRHLDESEEFVKDTNVGRQGHILTQGCEKIGHMEKFHPRNDSRTNYLVQRVTIQGTCTCITVSAGRYLAFFHATIKIVSWKKCPWRLSVPPRCCPSSCICDNAHNFTSSVGKHAREKTIASS